MLGKSRPFGFPFLLFYFIPSPLYVDVEFDNHCHFINFIDSPAASHLCYNSSSGPLFSVVFMMYRIVCNLVVIPARYLTQTISVRGNNMKFLVPYARTLVYRRSFFTDTIRIWKSLPQPVVSCPTLDRADRHSAKLVLCDFNCIVHMLF